MYTQRSPSQSPIGKNRILNLLPNRKKISQKFHKIPFCAEGRPYQISKVGSNRFVNNFFT